MRTIETKVYTINEHPNKDNVFEWIRSNWHDLNNHSVDEFIDSLKALEREIGGTLEYSIGASPVRGEHISLTGYDKQALQELKKDNCPLTGVCWDYDIIEALQNGNIQSALTALHKDTEYAYSDKGLTKHCEANEYEFDINGKFYS